MSDYNDTEALSLDTSVSVSGTGGTSTPEAAVPNSSYSAWSWEITLATVLEIPISDRSEVTGQSWLTIVQGDAPDPAAHQIWSASWTTKPKTGAATSLRVFLNPELYLGGGAWDRFADVPAQALSGPATGLPLVPQSFYAAKLALAGVTTGFYDMSADLDSMHHDLMSEGTPFQGNTANVIAELMSRLHGATQSFYDQMSNPSRSDAVAAAGDAATAFLSAINGAYEAWTKLPEHSPLGAIVHVLASAATPDGNGGYTIPDPENTPFGDLTTPEAWTSVEQQAKAIWTGLLTATSADFDGLDRLSRTALSQLADQYATTTGIVVPVGGPAPPSVVQTPVGGPNGFGDGGGPQGGPNSGRQPKADFVTGGGGGGGGGQGPPVLTPGATPPITPGAHPQALVSQLQDPAGEPVAAGPAGPGFLGGQAGLPDGSGPLMLAASDAVPDRGPGRIEEDAEPPGLDLPLTSGVRSGVIGAMPAPADRFVSPAADPAAGPAGERFKPPQGFSGTVGRGPEANGPALGRPDREPNRDVDLESVTGAARKTGILTAPAAGFSVGGGPPGSVLTRSAVSFVSDKPPSITSSQVNMQLTPGGGPDGGVSGSPGLAFPSSPAGTTELAGSPASGLLAGQIGGPLAGQAAGSGAVPGQPWPLAGQGTQGGSKVPMGMPPRSGSGGMTSPGQDHDRRAYVPEDESYWGTGPRLPGPADRDITDEPDFEVSRVIAGIGAELTPNASQETTSNWRTL